MTSTPPPPTSATRAERLDLYQVAVEEYRFQVTLNWDRAKYLIGFNTLVISVGTAFIQVDQTRAEWLVAGIFLVGLLSAVLAAAALRVQHAYYRQARDRMTTLGADLGLGDDAVATTPGSGAGRAGLLSWLTRVQTILYALLAACAVVNAGGIAYALGQ